MLYTSYSHSGALIQLRFTSLVMINLRGNIHPQEYAQAGRTKKKGHHLSEAPFKKEKTLLTNQFNELVRYTQDMYRLPL